MNSHVVQLTCIFWTPTHMLHGRDTHLFTRTTDPMTLTCRGLHLNAYGRHSAVRFSHQQHLHLPCLPPKNPPSGLNLTKISLPARTSFVVRTYILTPALSPTNSAFRCTWQQVLLTFPRHFSPPMRAFGVLDHIRRTCQSLTIRFSRGLLESSPDPGHPGHDL